MLTAVSLICLDPSFQKMTHHNLLHGSLRPTNFEKNLKPCNFTLKSLAYLDLWVKSFLTLYLQVLSDVQISFANCLNSSTYRYLDISNVEITKNYVDLGAILAPYDAKK